MAIPLHIIIATRNRHKVRELARLLSLRGIRWHSLAEFPQVPPTEETGRTFDANAVKKARAVAKATGSLVLADDSGLEVDALDGAPGIRSARFAGEPSDDRANNEKLLRMLEGVPSSRRIARYRCSLALAAPTRLLAITRGTWSGRVGTRPVGRHGFGYDPIIVIPRYQQTVGQLPDRVKQRLSHRARAARRLRPVLHRLVRQAGARGMVASGQERGRRGRS